MSVSLEFLVEQLKAAGESTRARVLALLEHGELSVGELAQILGQSQPRLSRHMKFLTSVGLVERMPEGAWVFYRLAPDGPARQLCEAILSQLDRKDSIITRDLMQLEDVRHTRREEAQHFFEQAAHEWDAIRALHYPEADIEAAIVEMAGQTRLGRVVDVGTGTGRMLMLFSDFAETVEGIDLSHQMLNVARANLNAAEKTNAVVRHGDANALPWDHSSADIVILHQVLHFLEEPGRAVLEAARVLTSDGRLIVVDFAPHDLEHLRREQSHRHLGISEAYFADLCDRAGLVVHQTRKFEAPENGIAVTIWVAGKATTPGVVSQERVMG